MPKSVAIAKRHVMLVEDDPIVALDLRVQLEGEGFQVLGPYTRGSAASQALIEARPDFAVVDYHLMDGTAEELAMTLQKEAIPYALVTVAREGSIPKQLTPRGHLEKPFLPEVLARTITTSLSSDRPM